MCGLDPACPGRPVDWALARATGLSYGGVAEWFRQWPAKPRTPVRFRSPPRERRSMAAFGRLAQGESASLTRKRSEVQILYRPPPETLD